MKNKLLLRIASVVMLLHTIGHSFGAFTWKEAPNSTVAGVIQGMDNTHFDFFGRQVTLGLFFQGYGVEMIAVYLFITLLLWLSGTYLQDKMTRKLLPLLMALLLFFAAAEWVYFFALPAALTTVAALLTIVAYPRTATPKP